MVKEITEHKKAEKALQKSEEMFRTLMEEAPIAICNTDLKGKITYVNKRFEEATGYSRQEIIGKDGFKLGIMSDETLKLFAKRIRDRLMGQTSRLLEGRFKRKDGEWMWAEVEGRLIKKFGVPVGFQLIARDITERKRAENERKRFEEKLSALNIYSRNLNTAKNMEDIHELTLDATEKILGFEFADILITEGNVLCLATYRGHSRISSLKLPLNGDVGVTVKAARTGKPIFVPDISKEKAYVEGGLGALSELAVPMRIGDKVLGVLNVESKELDAFNEKDRELLEILAAHAATAISNMTKRYEIERHSSQLASLMKSSAKMIQSTDLHQRLQSIVEAIRDMGWRRVVLYLVDENFEITRPIDVVATGVSEDERERLWLNRASGHVWRARFGLEYQRFRIGEFYHLPWSDPWVRKQFNEDTIQSHLKPEEMVDWDTQDLLYAPLRLAEGPIVGIVSMDDPVDGKRPTKESLVPLELFLYQAAVAIENAHLIQQQKEYMGHLEEKVEERTKQLKEAQEQLIKSERLAAIGQVAAMVGHDLRNPLTGIKGAAYYLRNKLGPKMDEKSKEMLELVEKDVECANKIIADLMEYSREIRLDLTETTPKSVIKETLALVEVPDNVQLIDLTLDKPEAKVDVEKMERVFANLIKNAIDAMPVGGKLEITSKESNVNIEIAFADTGIGMTKEIMEKIWTPFFTTKAKGMGLGLAICKRIVEAHGGSISVESTVDGGTTFTVIIPVKPKIQKESETYSEEKVIEFIETHVKEPEEEKTITHQKPH
jgi:PAS domain S-box-containing protein